MAADKGEEGTKEATEGDEPDEEHDPGEGGRDDGILSVGELETGRGARFVHGRGSCTGEGAERVLRMLVGME